MHTGGRSCGENENSGNGYASGTSGRGGGGGGAAQARSSWHDMPEVQEFTEDEVSCSDGRGVGDQGMRQTNTLFCYWVGVQGQGGDVRAGERRKGGGQLSVMNRGLFFFPN